LNTGKIDSKVLHKLIKSILNIHYSPYLISQDFTLTKKKKKEEEEERKISTDFTDRRGEGQNSMEDRNYEPITISLRIACYPYST
jgi:hypothetical protein